MADLYRTVIVLEVLHKNPLPSDMELPDIVRETVSGAWSGSWKSTSQSITPEAMATSLAAHGTDPAFLLGNDWNAAPPFTNRTPGSGEDNADE